jgi:hypothetical protein
MNTPDQSCPPPAAGRNGTHADRDQDVDRGGQDVSRSKFDLGQRRADLPTENIPWGYGEDRITAMARDPDWLYVYWEITDEAIGAARARLGSVGVDAWLSLRIYDTTGRIFDGTNAIDHFDIAIERVSRDWFVHVARPATSVHVDVGLKARDGSYQTIARSGRADFPRKRPSPDTTLQWLSVTPGMQAEPTPTAAPYRSAYAGPEPELEPSAPPERTPTPPPPPPDRTRHVEEREVAVFWKTTWQECRLVPWSMVVSHRYETTFQRVSAPWFTSTWRTEWQGDRKAFEWFAPLHSFAWSGSLPHFQWVEGPIATDDLDLPRVVMHLVGPAEVVAEWGGQSAFVSGPWHVVIRGFSTTPDRRVLGSWVLRWAQPVHQRWERWETPAHRAWMQVFDREWVALGASESQHWAERTVQELWKIGASESLWLAGGEVVAIGASEIALLAGSEWMLGGASETISAWSRVQLGASEQWILGGSERWMRGGASEQWTALGASWLAGASEQVLVGASEQGAAGVHERLGASDRLGASELVGASEQWLLGASEWVGSRAVAREELVEAGLGGSGPLQIGASEYVPQGASEHSPTRPWPGTVDDDHDKGGA